MGDKTSIVKASSVYIVLGFLPMGINFLLAPLYSYYLDPDQYGIIALADIFNGFVAVIISLGIKQAYARFFFDHYRNPADLNKLFTTSLFWLLTAAITVAVILYFAGDWVFGISFNTTEFSYSRYGWLVLISTTFTLINELFLSHYRNQEDVKTYSAISIAFFSVNVICILIGVVVMEQGAMGNIAGRAVGTVLTMSVVIGVYLIRHGIHIKPTFIKPMLEYGLPLIPYSLLLVAYNKIDRIMIDQFFDPETLGKYNFAFLLGTAIAVVQYSIYNAINPRLYKLLAETPDNYEHEISQIHRVFQLIMTGVIVCAIAVVVPIVWWFIDVDYLEITSYCGLLFLLYFAQNYYMIYTLPLFYYKRTKIMPIISLIALLGGIAYNLLFIEPWGIVGVCLAVILTKYTQLIGALWFNRVYGYHKLPLFNMRKNWIAVALITGLYGLGFLFIPAPTVEYYGLLNLIPLALFLILCVTLFRSEILQVTRLIRMTLNPNQEINLDDEE